MLTIIALMWPSAVHGGTGALITSSTSSSPVSIDGKWTTVDEWQDAVDLDCGGYGWIAVKDDSDFLYVLVDYTKDLSTTSGDFAWVAWDQKNDGGSKPKTDDYNLLVSYKNGSGYDVFVQQGVGTGWGASMPASSFGIWAASSTDATEDPYLYTPHVTYEFRIPRAVVDNSTMITTVGFYAGASDKTSGIGIRLPRSSDYMNPGSWGRLTFSVPIPEFTEFCIVTATLLSTSAIVLRRKENRPRSD